MHFIRSIAIFATILILPSVVFASKTEETKTDVPKTDVPKTDVPKTDVPKTDETKNSPVKTFVDAIDALVTNKQHKDLVADLGTEAQWNSYYAQLHVIDLAGTKELVAEVNKIITPLEADTAKIQLVQGAKLSDELNAHIAQLPKPDTFASVDAVKAFNPVTYVQSVHDILVKYDATVKADTEGKVFKKKPSVDDLAGDLAGAFDKLTEAAFKSEDQKAFLAKLKKSAKGGAAGGWEMWQIALIIIASAAVVIGIAVAVYFLVVKRKN
jgi:hypothetical protein